MQNEQHDSDRRGWITVFILSTAQALSQSGSTLVMTVTALTGVYLTNDLAMATLPLALQFLATMIATIPASLFMDRVGRRLGFSLGQTIGAVFALLCAYGIYQGSYWLFAVGSAGIGIHNAFWQYLRFAASEAVSTPGRARAISYVLAGGVVAAFVGPWLATQSRELFSPVLYAGSYVALAGLSSVTIFLLQTARFCAPIEKLHADDARPLKDIVRQPIFCTAVMSAAFGYGVMVLVMTATPLAMVEHGFEFNDAAFVIQWHVLGMFVPSFFTGKLIERFGVLPIISIGALLNLLTMSANLSGVALGNFWIGLVALGVGWNFMFIGGTTLLTESYRPGERAKVQALNDFLVFGTVTAASFSSGALQSALGWSMINVALAVPMVLMLAVVTRLMQHRKMAEI